MKSLIEFSMEEKKVELNLGLVCNNFCKFCMNDEPPKKRRFVSSEILKKELRDFRKKGCNAVGFLGGEPTIYPGLIEIIELASKIGYQGIHLVSNGRKYKDRDFLQRLISSGATRFYVSIHSHRPEIEDFLTSVKGGFKEKIKGISNLVFFKKRGLIKDNILLNSVINKYNYRYLPNIIFFFRKNFGLTDFRFNFIQPAGRALKNYNILVPKYLEIKKHLWEAIDLSRQLGVNLCLEAIPFCFLHGVKKFEELIGEFKDGKRQARFGNEQREGFFIETRRKETLKIKGKNCKKCIYNDDCEGPWKNYVDFYDFHELKPIRMANHRDK